MVRLTGVGRTALALVLVFLTCSCAVGQTASDEKLTEEEAKLLKRVNETKVTLDFDNASLDYIVQNLREQTQLLFVIAPNIDAKEKRITIHLKDVSLETALDCLLTFEGLAFFPEGDMILISPIWEARRKGLQTRAYDISDLLFSPQDIVRRRHLSGDAYSGSYGARRVTMSSSEIVDLLAIAAFEGAAGDESIRLQDNVILAKADGGAHERMAQLLEDLRDEGQLRIRIYGHLLRLPPGDALAFAAQKQNVMSSEAAEKLLKKQFESGKIVRSFVVSCVNGQQNGVESVVAREYVKDFDMQVAASATVADPIPGQCWDGYAFEFLPRADALGKTVQLSVSAEITKPDAQFGVINTTAGAVQLPTIALKTIATTVFLKDGEFLLFELGRTEDEADAACLLVGVAMVKEESKTRRLDDELIARRAQARDAALQKLAGTRLSVNFQNAALPEVFDYLRKNTPFNFFVENNLLNRMQAEDMRFTMIAKEMPVKRLLDTIAQFHPVRYEPMDEVVVVLEPGRVFEQPIVRRYSLADFVENCVDYDWYGFERVGGGLSRGMEAGLGMATSFAAGETDLSPVALSAEGLIHMVKNEIDPESWDCEYTAMVLDSAKGLTIRHLPHVHDKILNLIEKYRQAAHRMINVDVRLVEVNKGIVQELAARKEKDTLILDDSARERLLRDSDNVKPWRSYNFTCMNGQSVCCGDVREHSTVSDYDVQISTSAPAYDPVISLLSTGVGVKFLGTIASNGQDLQMECKTVIGLETGPMQTAETGGGAIQLAQVQRTCASTTTTVPSGQTVVVFTTAASPNMKDGVFLVLVRPSIVKR